MWLGFLLGQALKPESFELRSSILKVFRIVSA